MDELINVPSALSAASDDGISVAADECTTLVENAGGIVCSITCQPSSQCTASSESCTTLAETVICSAGCEVSSQGSKPGVGTSLTVSNVTSSSAYISFAAISGATRYTIAYRLDSPGATATEISTTNTYYTLTGLSPNTAYVVNYRGVNYYGTSGYMAKGVDFTTKRDNLGVSHWSWTSSNGNATAEQTQAAYTAITTQGKLRDFSYLVWNDMCAKVLEVMQADGYSWSTANYGTVDDVHYCGTYAETLMSPTDKEMTAHRFNSLRYNVGSRKSTDIKYSDIQTGKIIKGSYFTTLMSIVNSWIDSPIN